VSSDLFLSAAGKAGADGLIIPDWVPEESQAYKNQLVAADLDLIQLVAPNTAPKRIKLLNEISTSFIYCMAYTGVTGQSGSGSIADRFLSDMRRKTSHPLMVGFGVKNKQDYLRYSKEADGVIIGSAFLEMLAKTPRGQLAEATKKFIGSIR